MREYFRPYNKIIQMASADPSTVLLTDSGGELLACNYVSVTSVSSDATENSFQVIPSGVNTLYGGTDGGTLSGRDLGPSAYPDASGRVSNSGSGVLGLYADTGAGTVIMSLSPWDATNAIIISQKIVTNALYAVTYGQVNLANTRADNTFNPDEQTWLSAIASFTSSVDATTSTVIFTNDSSGVNQTYKWDFDVTGAATVDSTVASPTHTYTSGTPPFTAELTLSTLHGGSTASGLVSF